MSKQLNKILNLLQNTNFGRSNKRKKGRRRRNRYTAVPQISGQPQRLGIGSTVARITREISVTQNSQTTVEFMSLVTDSYEFSRQAESYNFFRVKCINVIQHPINVNDVNGKAWLVMDWLNSDNISETTMGTWDNAKMLSYNAVKPITYTFLPPNARLRYGANDDELLNSDLPINLTEWIPARELVAKNVPGWLKFMNVGNKDLSITADAVLEFKGAKGYDTVLTKACKFIHNGPLKELKQEKDIKEDVKEEEKKNKVRKIKKEEKKNRIKEYEEKVQDLSD
jgi:hypothetical protein